MSKKMNLVIFAFPAWEGDYGKSTVFLTNEFSYRDDIQKVLYIDYQYTWKDLIFNKYASWKRMLGISKSTIKHNNVWVHTLPPIIPMNWAKNSKIYTTLLNINGALIKRSILKVFKKLKIENPIIINAFNPVFGYYLHNQLNEKLNVYYCYDEISACEWANEHGSKFETLYAQKVNMIATTSPSLQQKLLKINSNTVLVPNGVDYKLYDKYFNSRKFEVQSNIIIGYLGSIDNRLDYDILEYMIQTIPEAKFKFMGRITDNRAYNLQKYDNVELTGALNSEELAIQTNLLSLGIIPFVKNEFTKNVYPLKINEYFAAGLPVVSTNFADLSDFKDEIRLANDKITFTNEVKKEIIRNNPIKAITRNRIASHNSWKSRAALFIKYIKQHIDAK